MLLTMVKSSQLLGRYLRFVNCVHCLRIITLVAHRRSRVCVMVTHRRSRVCVMDGVGSNVTDKKVT